MTSQSHHHETTFDDVINDNDVINTSDVIPVEDQLFPYANENDPETDDVTGNDVIQSSHNLLSMTSHLDGSGEEVDESGNDLTEVDVYTKLEMKERDLVLAAQLGKSLLEKNEMLVEEKEQIQQEYYERVEILEQEKHELSQKLERKTQECQSQHYQHEQDISILHEQLENSQTMLNSVEKERTRISIELNEQNHKLRNQLQKASDAEQQLSIQVQQLRKEFLERFNSNNLRIEQLEISEAQVDDDAKEMKEMEISIDEMNQMTSQLKDELTTQQLRNDELEQEVERQNFELKSNNEELHENEKTISLLQQRVEELQHEVLDISYSRNSQYSQNTINNNTANTSSLLSELEQSGCDYDDIIAFHDNNNVITSANNQEFEQNDKTVMQRQQSTSSTTSSNSGGGTKGRIAPLLKIYQRLTHGLENCNLQLFQLKQEMWDSFQKLQTISSTLRVHLNQYQNHEGVKQTGGKQTEEDTKQQEEKQEETNEQANLPSAIQQLSLLVNDVIHAKDRKETSQEIIKMLHEKQNNLLIERDQAVNEQNSLQMKLAEAKTDLLSVNRQLLEAIQQKLQQQKELEAWQDDMEQMIQKTVSVSNVPNKMVITSGKPPIQQPSTRSNWFSFRRSLTPSTSTQLSSAGESQQQSPNDVINTPSTSPSVGKTPQSQPSGGGGGMFTSWFQRSTSSVKRQLSGSDTSSIVTSSTLPLSDDDTKSVTSQT